MDAYLRLRIVVGALGEGAQPPWWRTQFFGAAGQRFLKEHLFPRTALPAAVAGVSQAACRLYDPLLAGAQAYHLFRLPPEFELELRDRERYSQPAVAAAAAALASRDALQDLVAGMAAGGGGPIADGPVSCGDERTLRSSRGPALLAAHYASAIATGRRVLPYFEAAP